MQVHQYVFFVCVIEWQFLSADYEVVGCDSIWNAQLSFYSYNVSPFIFIYIYFLDGKVQKTWQFT